MGAAHPVAHWSLHQPRRRSQRHLMTFKSIETCNGSGPHFYRTRIAGCTTLISRVKAHRTARLSPIIIVGNAFIIKGRLRHAVQDFNESSG